MKINKIYNEDCLNTMKSMNNDFVDITITSPPYNIGLSRRNRNTKGFTDLLKYDNYYDNLKNKEYNKLICTWLSEIIRVTKYHVFFNIQEVKGNKGVIKIIYENFSEQIKDVFIWAKPNPPSAINDNGVSKGYEYIFCFSKDQPNKSVFNYKNFSNYNGDYVKNIIIKPVNSDKETKKHNFAFPLWLPKYFINYFSKKNALIYDPFMGIGTTGVACVLLNRNFIGSEISEKYVELANKRIKQHQFQTRLF